MSGVVPSSGLGTKFLSSTPIQALTGTNTETLGGRLAVDIFFYTILLPTIMAVPWGAVGAYKENKSYKESERGGAQRGFEPKLAAMLTGFVNGYLNGWVSISQVLALAPFFHQASLFKKTPISAPVFGKFSDTLGWRLGRDFGVAPLGLAFPGGLVGGANKHREYKGEARSINGTWRQGLAEAFHGFREGYRKRWKNAVLTMIGFLVLKAVAQKLSVRAQDPNWKLLVDRLFSLWTLPPWSR